MVSFELDSFITDKDKTIWIATLSDGRVVYEDEYRPEYTEHRAWIRLGQFCQENNLYVKKMAIKFRSHIEELEESSEGYFFRRGALGSHGASKKTTRHFYLSGPIIDGIICVSKWLVPELILEESENREIEGNRDGIIWNLSLHPEETNVPQPNT